MEGASKTSNFQQATEAYKAHYDTYFKRVDEMHKNITQWDVDYKKTAQKVDEWCAANRRTSYKSYPSKDEITLDFRAKVTLREEYRVVRNDLRRIETIFQQAAKEGNTSPEFAIQKVNIDTLKGLSEKYFAELKVPLEKLGKIESGYYVDAGIGSMIWNGVSWALGYTHVHAAKVALAQPSVTSPEMGPSSETHGEEKKSEEGVSAPAVTVELSSANAPAPQATKSAPQQNSPTLKPKKGAPHAPVAVKAEGSKEDFPALPQKAKQYREGTQAEEGLLGMLASILNPQKEKATYADAARAPSPQNSKEKKA